ELRAICGTATPNLDPSRSKWSRCGKSIFLNKENTNASIVFGCPITSLFECRQRRFGKGYIQLKDIPLSTTTRFNQLSLHRLFLLLFSQQHHESSLDKHKNLPLPSRQQLYQ